MDFDLHHGLTFFRTALVLFVLVGWAWPRARRWHLMALMFSALSWFLLGLHDGMEYGVLIDWHWGVREHLWRWSLSLASVEDMLEQATGRDFAPHLVANLSLGAFVLVLQISIMTRLLTRHGR